MALSAQTQNFVTRLMARAEEMLEQDQEFADEIDRFNSLDMYSQLAVLAEVQAIFPHLSQSKIGNAVAVMVALKVVYDAGTNKTALRQMKS